jgi:hypothetical protein
MNPDAKERPSHLLITVSRIKAIDIPINAATEVIHQIDDAMHPPLMKSYLFLHFFSSPIEKNIPSK